MDHLQMNGGRPHDGGTASGRMVAVGAAFAGAFGMALAACAHTPSYLDVPLSSATNRAYLSSMPARPWWNESWTRRAPLLVSSMSDEKDAQAVVDVVVDPGERVVPSEVRLVTPWETEIPVCCEAKGGTKIGLLFKTSLRIRENRPFLLYWGNPGAAAPRRASALSLEVNAEEVRMANGVLDVVFDNSHRTDGLVKVFRLVSSQTPNQLLERATGYAWRGFAVHFGGKGTWSKAKVVADNPLKKTIRFTQERGEIDFTLYAEQPRLDYAYRI